MKPTHCKCGAVLVWRISRDWPGEGVDEADCESWDCADCSCGRQYTVLPDGTIHIDADTESEAA